VADSVQGEHMDRSRTSLLMAFNFRSSVRMVSAEGVLAGRRAPVHSKPLLSAYEAGYSSGVLGQAASYFIRASHATTPPAERPSLREHSRKAKTREAQEDAE
jgi:hypothetical protein